MAFFPARLLADPSALGRAQHPSVLLCLSPYPGASKVKALTKGLLFSVLPFSTPRKAISTHRKHKSAHSPGAAARLCWPLGHRMVTATTLSPPSITLPRFLQAVYKGKRWEEDLQPSLESTQGCGHWGATPVHKGHP